MEKIIEYVTEKKGKLIELEARITAIELYKKHQFIVIGNEYPSERTGVMHIKMQLIIRANQ